jgi:hypothetical protein
MLFSQLGPDPSSGLTREERHFLLAAVDAYCAEHCPLTRGEGTCPLLTWRESVHTGALEKVCAEPPAEWATRLRELGDLSGGADRRLA